MAGGVILAAALSGAISETVAQDPTFLVQELPAPAAAKSSGAPIAGVSDGARGFFFATTELAGLEPWVSDGTEDGTHQVHDVIPGARGVAFGLSVASLSGVIIEDRFVFRTGQGAIWVSDSAGRSASPVDLGEEVVVSEVGKAGRAAIVMAEGDSGPGLWSIDPFIGQAVLLRRFEFSDALEVSFPDRPAQFTELDGISYFPAEDAETGVELWSTDGTVEGTGRFADINPGEASSNPIHLGRAGDRLFFLARARWRAGLWVVEGGSLRFVAPYLVQRQPAVTAYHADGGVFLVQNNVLTGISEVFHSDGTAEGSRTLLSKRVVRFPSIAAGVAVGHTLYVPIQQTFTRSELCSVDAAIQEVRCFDLDLRRIESVTNLAAWGNRAVFTAADSKRRLRFWLVEEGGDPWPIPRVRLRSSEVNLLPVGDLLLYTGGDDDISGRELLKTDSSGLEAGTVANIALDVEADIPTTLVATRTHAYFGVSGRTPGVWRSDGTSAGTFRLVGPGRLLQNSAPYSLLDSPSAAAIGDRLVFRTWAAMRGYELWVTDGSQTGTTVLLEPSSETFSLTEHRGLVFFTNEGNRGSPKLWVSDGTAGGTAQLLERSFYATYLESIGDQVVAYSGIDYEFPRIETVDPGAGRVELLKDFYRRLPSDPIVPRWFLPLGDQVVFAAADREHGDELWISDGTAEGTRLAVDINPNLVVDESTLEVLAGAGSYPHDIVSLGDRLFFFADDGRHGLELWTSDATRDGTWLVRDIVPGPDSPLVTYDREYYPSSTESSQMVAAGSRVFFVADDWIHGREVWTSDGSEEGTFLLRDIAPGRRSSNPTSLSGIDGVLLFSACDEVGCEPWVSNGSAAGTTRLADIVPGPLSSSPTVFVSVGDRVVFGVRTERAGQVRGFPREELPSPVGATPRPTPTARPSTTCPGDCNSDGSVAISELIRGVRIALADDGAAECAALDTNGDDRIAVNELVGGVAAALRGCTAV